MYFMLAFAAVILLAALLIVWTKKDRGSHKSSKTIPCWTAQPANDELGDLGELTRHGSLHSYLLHLHQKGKIPITSFWWGKTQVISVCNPQAFKELTGLVNRPVLLFKALEPLIGAGSIQYANGEDWNQRQKCLYKTLKGEELKDYFPKFVQIAQETERKWMNYSTSNQLNLLKEVLHMTVKGICLTCLGDIFHDDQELDILCTACNKCWKEMEERLMTGEPEEGDKRIEDYKNNRQILMDIVAKIIQNRRADGDREEVPFIDSMLQNYTSDEMIIADVISFLFGGFHTTGYMLTWLLWYLASNPSFQVRLLDELQKEVGGECGDKLKAYALRTDTFMRQVEDETLRLSCVASFGARYSDKDVWVCGYRVPAQTPIITALGVALNNTEQWQDEEKWDPERFGPQGKRGAEFCPFGIQSRRKCPGYSLAYFEVAIFVAILLQRFEVIPVEGRDVSQMYGLVTKPKEDIYIQLLQRNQSK